MISGSFLLVQLNVLDIYCPLLCGPADFAYEWLRTQVSSCCKITGNGSVSDVMPNSEGWWWLNVVVLWLFPVYFLSADSDSLLPILLLSEIVFVPKHLKTISMLSSQLTIYIILTPSHLVYFLDMENSHLINFWYAHNVTHYIRHVEQHQNMFVLFLFMRHPKCVYVCSFIHWSPFSRTFNYVKSSWSFYCFDIPRFITPPSLHHHAAHSLSSFLWKLVMNFKSFLRRPRKFVSAKSHLRVTGISQAPDDSFNEKNIIQLLPSLKTSRAVFAILF